MAERDVMPNNPFKKARTPFEAITSLGTESQEEKATEGQEEVAVVEGKKAAEPRLRVVEATKKGKSEKKPRAKALKQTTKPSPRTGEKPKRGKVGFYWDSGLHEEALSCAHYVADFVNISHFSEEAARALLQRMREKYNDGKPFPPLPPEVKARLRGGRPPGS